jgi:hypothetical protein
MHIKWLHDNGLSLTFFVLFAASLAGQIVSGRADYNEEQLAHGDPSIGVVTYLQTGDFVEAVAENWESEFLQMAAYVLLTIFLFQRGSSESKDPDKSRDEVDRVPVSRPEAPWPVRRGGLALRVYEHSLSLAFFALFALSFVLHAYGGAAAYNEELTDLGKPAIGVTAYLATPRFWFESFQNWQSEFISIWAMIVLSIFLRQKGSPESKPVDAPHRQTGS